MNMSNMMTRGQSRPSIEELNVRLVFTTSTSPIARMPPPSSNAWPHAKGKLRKRRGFGAKPFFIVSLTFPSSLFMQKQITHDDVVPLVQNHGNNEVLDVPVRIRHDSMRVSPQLHGKLHWSKEATASSKRPSPPTQMPPHSLSTGQREKDTHGGMTQKVR